MHTSLLNFILLGHSVALSLNSTQLLSQDFDENQNILKYTANRGPYTNRRGLILNRDPPPGCVVDQVVMLARQDMPWPSKKDLKAEIESLEKVKSVSKLQGSLEFVETWDFYVNYTDDGEVNNTEASANLVKEQANNLGKLYRNPYENLFDDMGHLPLFVSTSQHNNDSIAADFGQGFLGQNYTDLARFVHVNKDNGSNSLSPKCKVKPVTTCPPFSYPIEFTIAASRLNGEVPGMNLNETDILHLMDISGYELSNKGESPWVDVFTPEEWVAYEYYVTSNFYCFKGPGEETSRAIGSVFLNGVNDLFRSGPQQSKLPLAFSFTDDIGLYRVISALGIDNPTNTINWDPRRTKYNQKYTLSDLIPHGARLVFERLNCEEASKQPGYINEYRFPTKHKRPKTNGKAKTNEFVRIILNEAVVPHPVCNTGPGASCNMWDFNNWVYRVTKNNDYSRSCGVKRNQPASFDVFSSYGDDQ